jgi:glutamate synthase (ferredoxin)
MQGKGLYDERFEHDGCGVGFVAALEGRPDTRVLPLALTALARLVHRGGVDADGRTGDGAGVLTGIPYALFAPALAALDRGPVVPSDLAVGLLFLPREAARCAQGQRIATSALAAQGLAWLGWREVPVRDEALGDKARDSRPELRHLLAGRPPGATDEDFERRLYLARRAMETQAAAAGLEEFYVASLSHRTLVYKALARGADLPAVFPDLRSASYATSFAVFHQRFSTNTLPRWSMAQPFRHLSHNGEINTVQGNRLWMRAREEASPSGLTAALPATLVGEKASDSASLDEALALLVRGGREALHAMSMLVPPAWENDAELPADVRAFFDYHACFAEPWDGPAFLAFADGRVVGACLDRNGLRPARYAVTADGLVLVGSEAGAFDVDPARVLYQGRLGPGEVLAVDLAARRLLDRAAVQARLARRRPYAAWMAEQRRTAPATSADAGDAPAPDLPTLRAHGYTREELQLVLGPMFKEGAEPLGSMGDDTPLAALTEQPRLLFSYFRQRFAQVTNPPIDPLRETLVMSLGMRLGPRGPLLEETPEHAAQVHVPSAVLDPGALAAVCGTAPLRARRLSTLWTAAGGPAAMHSALEELLAEAAQAVREGATLLVLSDRGLDAQRAALPALLAVSAVHQHLVREGLRLQASLAIETGEARDDHQVASLVAFGAEAVCPHVALGLVRALAARAGQDVQEAGARYRKALEKGLLKILAKMGISTLRSYHGAQLFEALGVHADVVERHFTGTPSQLGGVGLFGIAEEVLGRHRAAWAPEASDLPEGSLHRYRQKGERHAFEPPVVKALHAAIASGQRLDYHQYAALIRRRAPIALRDLLELREEQAVPITEVEPASSIVTRFYTAAMSLGALSPEAQQTLAVAMNRLGARSNSGEGGEPPELFSGRRRGPAAWNRVKQVASARFGVTAAYLTSADELQIKMAQGSKPGEGGQLPGHKVAGHIARVRHAPPGVTLISPPPHHDIYSIEDLAQLIHDLRRVNPRAAVSVKLVAEAGVGTVAAGVVKAGADAVVVAGHDGGTGASPLGSIKNAGAPWELGLAETQQVLARNGLRGRVRLQVEGGLKTGRDVVIAALLGADQYGFGTAALVAAGCVMARQCHLNTCPAGIATQREDLRRRFTGTPDDVVRFFTAVAEEVREVLAALGFRTLEQAVGQVERLVARELPAEAKAAAVDLDALLFAPGPGQERRWTRGRRNAPVVPQLEDLVLGRLHFEATQPRRLNVTLPIGNGDRSMGAGVAGQLARRYRGRQLAAGTVRLRFRGSAGQSFGAFCVEGMQLLLEGEANDALGKGMSGGEIVLRPARPVTGQVVAGNALLYGATGGQAFLAGRVGERFAVRNSGALAVVEGTGDHGCEYMTGGAAVILGEVGRNFGAGMTGGLAFVLDEGGHLRRRANAESVTVETGLEAAEERWLLQVLRRHALLTGSPRAHFLVSRWEETRAQFVRVAPAQSAAPRVLPALEGGRRRSSHRPVERGLLRVGPAHPLQVAVQGAGELDGGGAPAQVRRADLAQRDRHRPLDRAGQVGPPQRVL